MQSEPSPHERMIELLRDWVSAHVLAQDVRVHPTALEFFVMYSGPWGRDRELEVAALDLRIERHLGQRIMGLLMPRSGNEDLIVGWTKIERRAGSST